MRAYQLPKGGAGIDALVKVERPDPSPAYRQVVVKVEACSLNFRDLGIVRGTYRMPVRENLIPLSDGAGEVIEVGPGVTRVKVGDRVAGCFFQRWAAGEAPSDVHASALVWYDKWREYDIEDSVRFYSLRLREAGMIKSTPSKIIADGTNWRFLNQLKRELKG